MAYITSRKGADGSTSFYIKVLVGEEDGKQTTRSMTWKAPATMGEKTAQKKAAKEATLFEEKIKHGLNPFSGKTSFREFSESWLKNAELAPKTKERYIDLLTRINAAIGVIKLEKIQQQHLSDFYNTLKQPGAKNKGRFAQSTKLDSILQKRKLSRAAMGELAGVAASTVSTAARGQRISFDKAKQICAALDMPVSQVFTVCKETEPLSAKTIHHHHQLIKTILKSAKRQRLIIFNVAEELENVPKVPRTEAKYLDDEQAKHFLQLLMREDDIRCKTALILLLYTGMRRGELCGLSWPDIDFENKTIGVKRASQYQRKIGVVEVPTKNIHSERDIDVSDFVVSILREYKKWWIEQRLLFGVDWNGQQERLFVQERGEPINPDTINYWLTKFLDKHDMSHVSPHSLRHTFATLQITAGVDIRTLQARTGHSQASTLLNTYSHAIKSAQQHAAAALDNVLKPNEAI